MKIIRALMLVLVLSVCAYAGDIPCGLAGEVPSDKTGDMGAGGRAAVIDPVTGTAMQILQGLSLLF